MHFGKQRVGRASIRYAGAPLPLSRDELERLKGRPLSASEEAFLREVQGKPD